MSTKQDVNEIKKKSDRLETNDKSKKNNLIPPKINHPQSNKSCIQPSKQNNFICCLMKKINRYFCCHKKNKVNIILVPSVKSIREIIRKSQAEYLDKLNNNTINKNIEENIEENLMDVVPDNQNYLVIQHEPPNHDVFSYNYLNCDYVIVNNEVKMIIPKDTIKLTMLEMDELNIESNNVSKKHQELKEILYYLYENNDIKILSLKNEEPYF
jgi:hypothetical protein